MSLSKSSSAWRKAQLGASSLDIFGNVKRGGGGEPIRDPVSGSAVADLAAARALRDRVGLAAFPPPEASESAEFRADLRRTVDSLNHAIERYVQDMGSIPELGTAESAQSTQAGAVHPPHQQHSAWIFGAPAVPPLEIDSEAQSQPKALLSNAKQERRRSEAASDGPIAAGGGGGEVTKEPSELVRVAHARRDQYLEYKRELDQQVAAKREKARRDKMRARAEELHEEARLRRERQQLLREADAEIVREAGQPSQHLAGQLPLVLPQQPQKEPKAAFAPNLGFRRSARDDAKDPESSVGKENLPPTDAATEEELKGMRRHIIDNILSLQNAKQKERQDTVATALRALRQNYERAINVLRAQLESEKRNWESRYDSQQQEIDTLRRDMTHQQEMHKEAFEQLLDLQRQLTTRVAQLHTPSQSLPASQQAPPRPEFVRENFVPVAMHSQGGERRCLETLETASVSVSTNRPLPPRPLPTARQSQDQLQLQVQLQSGDRQRSGFDAPTQCTTAPRTPTQAVRSEGTAFQSIPATGNSASTRTINVARLQSLPPSSCARSVSERTEDILGIEDMFDDFIAEQRHEPIISADKTTAAAIAPQIQVEPLRSESVFMDVSEAENSESVAESASTGQRRPRDVLQAGMLPNCSEAEPSTAINPSQRSPTPSLHAVQALLAEISVGVRPNSRSCSQSHSAPQDSKVLCPPSVWSTLDPNTEVENSEEEEEGTDGHRARGRGTREEEVSDSGSERSEDLEIPSLQTVQRRISSAREDGTILPPQDDDDDSDEEATIRQMHGDTRQTMTVALEGTSRVRRELEDQEEVLQDQRVQGTRVGTVLTATNAIQETASVEDNVRAHGEERNVDVDSETSTDANVGWRKVTDADRRRLDSLRSAFAELERWTQEQESKRSEEPFVVTAAQMADTCVDFVVQCAENDDEAHDAEEFGDDRSEYSSFDQEDDPSS